MVQKVHVGLDKESGEVLGWDSIWAILKLEDDEKNKLKNVGKKYAENFQKI